MSKDVYIAGAVRTPIGKFGGSLADLSAVDLGEIAVKAAIERSGVDVEQVVETFIGHARQAACGPNPARQIAVRSGIPESRPAMTVNQACASGLRAIALAFQSVRHDEGELFVAGGTESMSNTPYMLPRARWGYRLGHGELVDGMYRDGFQCPIADQLMGRTAETLADEFKISREEQDEYAVETQRRAVAARDRLLEEITPVILRDRKGMETAFTTDEHIRANASIAGMANLRPAFRDDGTVHAGNSSGITDAAAACVVLSSEALKQSAVSPLARIVDYTAVGVEASRMGIGPVGAIRGLLKKTGLKLADIELIELNEAFAAQVIACDRELQLDMSKVNVNGGSIALGHPIGCSGTRIVVTLLHEMQRRQSRYGIATLCVSGGMGIAMLFERA